MLLMFHVVILHILCSPFAGCKTQTDDAINLGVPMDSALVSNSVDKEEDEKEVVKRDRIAN